MPCSTSEVRFVPLPGSRDVLTDLLRQGAQRMLSQSIEAEVQDWIEQHAGHRDRQGRQQVVRNGYLPGGAAMREAPPPQARAASRRTPKWARPTGRDIVCRSPPR
jgi:putative transposase